MIKREWGYQERMGQQPEGCWLVSRYVVCQSGDTSCERDEE